MERYENMDTDQISNPVAKESWIKTGLKWAAFMYMTMTIAFPYFNGQEITSKRLLSELVIWTIAGLMFGYISKIYMDKKTAKIHKKD